MLNLMSASQGIPLSIRCHFHIWVEMLLISVIVLKMMDPWDGTYMTTTKDPFKNLAVKATVSDQITVWSWLLLRNLSVLRRLAPQLFDAKMVFLKGFN